MLPPARHRTPTHRRVSEPLNPTHPHLSDDDVEVETRAAQRNTTLRRAASGVHDDEGDGEEATTPVVRVPSPGLAQRFGWTRSSRSGTRSIAPSARVAPVLDNGNNGNNNNNDLGGAIEMAPLVDRRIAEEAAETTDESTTNDLFVRSVGTQTDTVATGREVRYPLKFCSSRSVA